MVSGTGFGDPEALAVARQLHNSFGGGGGRSGGTHRDDGRGSRGNFSGRPQARHGAIATPKPDKVSNHWNGKLVTAPPEHLFENRSLVPVCQGTSTQTTQLSSPEPGMSTSQWSSETVHRNNATSHMSNVGDVHAATQSPQVMGAHRPLDYQQKPSDAVFSHHSNSGDCKHTSQVSNKPPDVMNFDSPAVSRSAATSQIVGAHPEFTSTTLSSRGSHVPAASMPSLMDIDIPITFQMGASQQAVTAPRPSVDTGKHKVDAKPTSPPKGLDKSRWASKKENVHIPTVHAVVDYNWLETYYIEDGGRIYGLAADKAKTAGDTQAEKLLRQVSSHAADVVTARLAHDDAAEARARNEAKKAAELAKKAFSTFHPRPPHVSPTAGSAGLGRALSASQHSGVQPSGHGAGKSGTMPSAGKTDQGMGKQAREQHVVSGRVGTSISPQASHPTSSIPSNPPQASYKSVQTPTAAQAGLQSASIAQTKTTKADGGFHLKPGQPSNFDDPWAQSILAEFARKN